MFARGHLWAAFALGKRPGASPTPVAFIIRPNRPRIGADAYGVVVHPVLMIGIRRVFVFVRRGV